MNLEAFNGLLKRNLDSRAFCTLDVDPNLVRFVKLTGQHREPENRYVIWLKLEDGTHKMLMVVRGDRGEFREPTEADIEELKSVLVLFERLWARQTEQGRQIVIKDICAALDQRFIETKAMKFRRMRDFIRGESAPRLAHIAQQCARAKWNGRRQHATS